METCLFCQDCQQKHSGKIVYEDDRALAFEDIDPKAPVHTLVIPKKHFSTLLDVSEAESDLMAQPAVCLREVAAGKALLNEAFRIVTNCNPESGQSVYHIHLHCHGRSPDALAAGIVKSLWK